MDNKKNQKKGAAPKKRPVQKAKAAQQPAKRRQPGANAKSRQPQKAPHAQPRKHAPVKEEPIRVTPEVVYLAPKPFSRNRLVLRLATVVAVVLALILGLSVFFKVENIEIAGCNQYTAWQVQQASGIEYGDQLLTFSVPRAAGKITDALPYVKTVRIGITLPDTVKIEIVESQVTYALQAEDETWWLMDSGGKIVASAEDAGSHTRIIGVSLKSPKVGEQAVAAELTGPRYDEEGNEIPVTVTAAQQLGCAVDIADFLESYGIIGDAASIDVTDIYSIEVWYGTKFQVLLGDSSDLNTKIRYMKSIIDDYAVNRPYESGVLDVSDPEWVEFQSFTE